MTWRDPALEAPPADAIILVRIQINSAGAPEVLPAIAMRFRGQPVRYRKPFALPDEPAAFLEGDVTGWQPLPAADPGYPDRQAELEAALRGARMTR